MNENSIGEEGKFLNFTAASRAMNIDPDTEQIKKYDEYPAKSNAIQYLFIVLCIAMLSLSIYWITGGHWILSGIGILATTFLALLANSFGKATLMKQIAYKNGLIIPAMITNTDPIEIIALANMGSKEEQQPIYGCLKMNVNALPNHTIAVGEKVPCISLFGAAINGYRRHFEPRPITWGFKEAALIPILIEIIAKDNNELNYADEWQMLDILKSQMTNATLGEVVFFDNNLKKITL